MASQLIAAPPTGIERLRVSLRDRIKWRDMLAAEVARLDADIRIDARVFATLNGDLMRPTLDQLRAMVAEPTEGKG